MVISSSSITSLYNILVAGVVAGGGGSLLAIHHIGLRRGERSGSRNVAKKKFSGPRHFGNRQRRPSMMRSS